MFFVRHRIRRAHGFFVNGSASDALYIKNRQAVEPVGFLRIPSYESCRL